MRVVALISGGKDSCYNMMQCVSAGHQIVALANLQPIEKDELDSFMFQTVGHEGIAAYAEAMRIPLYRRVTKGLAIKRELVYSPEDGDEVEDLYQLLKTVKDELQIEGVSVGAVLSDYQRLRVENVCGRLGLTSLAYLWRRDQQELLQEMIAAGVKAIIIKVASLGLNPHKHLGKRLDEMYPYLCELNKLYGVNICGEGGEYESFTLDCPLFEKEIIVHKSEVCIHSNDAIAPVGYLKLHQLSLIDKASDGMQIQRDSITVQCQNECSSPWSQDDSISLHNSQAISCHNKYTWIVHYGDRKSSSVLEQTQKIFSAFESTIHGLNLSWKNVVLVYLYLSDMDDYIEINRTYGNYFKLRPPARVCFQSSLPDGVLIKIEAMLYGGEDECKSMHVQSVSHWAPANIGPYSQAYVVSNMVYVAGQIGLVPSAMVLASEDEQPFLSLSHVSRVLEANGAHLGSALLGVCYYTTQRAEWIAKQEWRKHIVSLCSEYGCGCPISFIKVMGLPRQACVEWHFIAAKAIHPVSYSAHSFISKDMVVSMAEAWCKSLLVGSWIATVGPLLSFEKSPDIQQAVESGLEEMFILMSSRGIQWSSINLFRAFVPSCGQTSLLSSVYHAIKQCCASIPVSVVSTVGYFGTTCPIVLQAYSAE